MPAPVPVTHSLLSWEGVVALAGALGLGGIISALLQRPDRRTVNASAAKDLATGEAALITATAAAFSEVTGGLREEIERLQQVAIRFEADLASAHERAVLLEKQVEQLTADLTRVRGERDAALARVEQLQGELRQLQQLLTSSKRKDAPE